MELAIRNKGERKIVDIIGKIDRLKDSITLKSLLITLIEEGARKVGLNLSQVTYLDSGALNVFVFGSNTLKKEGGEICLIEPNEYVLDVLEIVGLAKLIPVFPTESEFESQLES